MEDQLQLPAVCVGYENVMYLPRNIEFLRLVLSYRAPGSRPIVAQTQRHFLIDLDSGDWEFRDDLLLYWLTNLWQRYCLRKAGKSDLEKLAGPYAFWPLNRPFIGENGNLIFSNEVACLLENFKNFAVVVDGD